MTAGRMSLCAVEAPPVPVDETAAAIFGGRLGASVVRCIRDQFAQPDELMHRLQDASEADGDRISATPAVRAFMRQLQKVVEQAAGR